MQLIIISQFSLIKNMKILEIITGLASGGAERFVVDLCNQFAKEGHSVSLLILKDLKYENFGFYLNDIYKDVHVESLGIRKFGPTIFFKLFKVINNKQVDIVHMHLASVPYFCVLPIIFHRKARYFVTSHNQAEAEKGNIRFLVKKILFKFKRFEQIGISDQNSTSVLNVFGKKTIATIYNGREQLKETDNFFEVKNVFDNYRKTGVSNIFVSVCRCQPQKNIPRLIRCFNKVIDKYSDTMLLIIGGGYDNEIGTLAKKNACNGIVFLGLKHNVVDFFKCADFFTLSSDYEGMPITLIEALSVGCIPLGTPVSGFNDIIKDGVNGFIAHDFGDDAYIKAIEDAINNKLKIKKDLLISTYKEKFSIEACAYSYMKLFELSKTSN